LIDRYRRLLDVVSRHPDATVGALLSMTREEGVIGRLRQTFLGRSFLS
jgi:hypothetical protein